MIDNKKIIVVLPAYNAARTLVKTYTEIPHDLVDEVILTDDASTDDTVTLARRLGIQTVLKHERTKGYGGNQKTCYDEALRRGGDIIIMLHPDYQYTPKLIPAMAGMIASGLYQVVLGSRILGRGAIRGGMPRYKYFANRLLTLVQNILLREKLSEYHTGYRAFARPVLELVPYHENSDDYVFDNQLLSQVVLAGYAIAEISCPTRYDAESSSITVGRSIRYGFGVLAVSVGHALHRAGLVNLSMYRFRR